MKQLTDKRAKELFHGSDIVRKYTFKTVSTGDSYALLGRSYRRMVSTLALFRDNSAHFQQKQQKNCFECHSPHEIAA